jgi:peptidoglycan/xylan/chitin deacetylase (PgdA/CDA1 family)
MYHHIQDEKTAQKNKQTNLSVSPDFFRKQLQYLKDKNYSVMGMSDLKNFFDNKISLPLKAVLITLDDGYKDN